jgi:hypothetical protein
VCERVLGVVGDMTYNWDYLIRDQRWQGDELEVEGQVELWSVLAGSRCPEGYIAVNG